MSDEEGDALAVMLQGNGLATKSNETEGINGYRKYREEWQDLCRLAESGLSEIQRHAVSMQLQGSHLRSVYWQLLLGSLPPAPSLWISIIRQQRNSYRLLHQRLSVDPHQTNQEDNPLSQSSASSWHQYFCDKELRALIRQDVVRTFPNVDFFRSESIQSTMVNILFCYAREHPEICYRQGMHEVVAPLLYVMQEDQKSLLRARELTPVSDSAVEILDPVCLEEDVYWLFCKLMSHLAGNYRVRDMIPLSNGHFPSALVSAHNLDKQSETELAGRLAYIRDELLCKFDKELYLHLKSLDIPFQTFGIRWLRLLFGQEFPLSDLLFIWDAVFAEGDNLINYIVVSMLSSIREQLIVEDDTECLMLLMRYPSGADVKSIVEHALCMWKPEKYSSSRVELTKREASDNPVVRKKAVSNSISGKFKKLNLWSQKRDVPQKHLPISNTPSCVGKAPTHLEKADGSQNVIEGFTLHDPNVARAELQHLHNLLSHVHLHLECYHATLEHTLPSNTPPAGREALCGIKQLCLQLNRSLPAAPRSVEVEAAFEAQPSPRIGAASNLKNISSDYFKKPEPQELQDKVNSNLNAGDIVTCSLPLNNPLRELNFKYFDRDVSTHVSYREELGSCNI